MKILCLLLLTCSAVAQDSDTNNIILQRIRASRATNHFVPPPAHTNSYLTWDSKRQLRAGEAFTVHSMTNPFVMLTNPESGKTFSFRYPEETWPLFAVVQTNFCQFTRTNSQRYFWAGSTNQTTGLGL